MDNCPLCGVDREQWGKLHICRPRPSVIPSQRGTTLDQPLIRVTEKGTDLPRRRGDGGERPATYKYRDPDKRRPQVAAAMRAYRARKKLST